MQKTQHLSAAPSDITPATGEPLAVDRLELISAYFDGEFEHSDLEQLSSTPSLATDLDPLDHKEDWALYALIADSLAQPATRALSPSVEFGTRLSAALQREPVHQPAAATERVHATAALAQGVTKPNAWPRWFSWPSLAMAAAVAAVVWVAQPLLVLDEAELVVTPTMVTQPPGNGATVSDYANAHRQLSGPIAVRQASFEPGVDR